MIWTFDAVYNNGIFSKIEKRNAMYSLRRCRQHQKRFNLLFVLLSIRIYYGKLKKKKTITKTFKYM